MNIDSLSQNVSEDMNIKQKVDKVYAFDPLTILTIISVIIAMIKLIKKCWNPFEASNKLSRPGPIVKWYLRKAVTKEIKKNLNREQQKAVGLAMRHSILNECCGLKEVEYADLYKEVSEIDD